MYKNSLSRAEHQRTHTRKSTMQLFSTLALILPSLFAATINGAVVRRVPVKSRGLIISPASDTTIAPGETFAIDYSGTNSCHAGYSPVSFYLSSEAPTAADLTSDGELSGALFHFGDFLVPNFGELHHIVLAPDPAHQPPCSRFTGPGWVHRTPYQLCHA